MKIIYKLSLLLSMILLAELSSVSVSAQQGGEKTLISNQDRTLTVYPIPANNRVNVRLSSALRQEVDKVEIVNLIGRKLTEQVIIDNNTTEITFNDLGDFPEGIYMVMARDKSGKIIQSSKLVINR
ncbi:T9SS type A sorting domain-containing protein [Taibaiella lutea]|uniref:T9SS type A sorting domain-containing protein n=1 Tax=Taibaiella lutea TaxID=2608001 RepID=A0A5M6CQL2_9BACT|nr:T9SS type A sorting domain-containing protein [Taibaiella lutea]KAA5536670.1 T9SS type A sorting domain-containing protein [Taibaiella lutea]